MLHFSNRGAPRPYRQGSFQSNIVLPHALNCLVRDDSLPIFKLWCDVNRFPIDWGLVKITPSSARGKGKGGTTLAAAKISFTASDISGPIPSPSISVTVYLPLKLQGCQQGLRASFVKLLLKLAVPAMEMAGVNVPYIWAFRAFEFRNSLLRRLDSIRVWLCPLWWRSSSQWKSSFKSGCFLSSEPVMMRESIAAAHSISAGIAWMAAKRSEGSAWLTKTVASQLDGADDSKEVGRDVWRSKLWSNSNCYHGKQPHPARPCRSGW